MFKTRKGRVVIPAVRGFDSFTVVLENEGKQNLVYKHAISTIVPSRNIDLNE